MFTRQSHNAFFNLYIQIFLVYSLSVKAELSQRFPAQCLLHLHPPSLHYFPSPLTHLLVQQTLVPLAIAPQLPSSLPGY